MIATSQAWKDNQNKQIRAEGDIRLTFYKTTDSGYEIDKVLTKNQIQSFRFETYGTMANETLPYTTITFSVFKTLGVLDTSGYVKYDIGYYLNGAWEWITYGYFIVKESNKPANGLIDTYNLISCFDIGSGTYPYKSIETTYKDGSYKYEGTLLNAYDVMTLAGKLNATFTPNYTGNIYSGFGLGYVSYIELARQLGILAGRTARLTNGRFDLIDLTNQNVVASISKINCFNKPEKTAVKYGTTLKVYRWDTAPFANIDLTNYDTIKLTNSQQIEWFDVEGGKYGQYSYYNDDRSFVINNRVRLYITPGTYDVKLYPFKDSPKFAISTITPEVLMEGANKETIEINTRLMSVSPNNYFMPYLEYVFSRNVFYEVECRIDPSFELFDLIGIDLPDDTVVIGFIEDINYSYNGSFKGKIKIRKIDTITKTPTPVISINNDELSLSNVVLANSVDVYVNGSLVLSNEPISSFPMPISKFYGEGFDYNQFSIKVKAKSILEDSDFSNELTQNVYVHIKALENTDIYVKKTNESDTIDLHYRLNGGAWQNYTVSSAEPFQTISISNGDILEFYGNNPNGFNSNFYSSGKTYIGGNIMSLLSNDFSITAIPSTSCFAESFCNSHAVGFSKYIFSNITSLNGEALSTSLDATNLISNQELVFHVLQIGARNLHSVIESTPKLVTTYVIEATTIDGSEALSVNYGQLYDRPNEIYFGLNLATLSSDYLGTQQDVYTLHFPHTDNDTVLFDANNIVYQATRQKDEHIVNIYTDNTGIKDACVAKRNEYTTVHVYHNDGTAWDV